MSERLAAHFASHLSMSRSWDRALRLRRLRVPFVPRLLMRRLRRRYACDVPLWVVRPDELYLLHNGLGVVIHPDTVFTGPTIVFHQVTFGNLWTSEHREGTPTIGSHVFIGAGAKILGRIHIGNYVVIGANAVVTSDVPDRTSVTTSGRHPIDEEHVRRVHFAHGRDVG